MNETCEENKKAYVLSQKVKEIRGGISVSWEYKILGKQFQISYAGKLLVMCSINIPALGYKIFESNNCLPGAYLSPQ